MDDMYGEFLNVAKQLNYRLKIVPLLYGSLGIQKITGIDFCPDDIDILIPKIFLIDKWNSLKGTIEELGYELIDLHEHEFIKGKYKIAFADIESLVPFAGIDFGNIENKSQNGIKYKILKMEDYLKVYSESLKDGYRKTKNNKDLLKIEIIKKLLENQL